ncbi:LacI family DNA-binding transcriptional regulator [Arthrobacter sp. TMN-37]
MEDVARLVGVSVSTVSRALRGSSSVRQQTREKVQDAARSLAFVPSPSASSLVTGKLNRIAVLLGSPLEHWFSGAMLDALYPVVHQAGYDLVLYLVRTGDQRARFFQDLPAQRNADAMIVASFALTRAEHERLNAMRVSTVYLNQHVQGQSSVAIDDVAGAQVAVRHLIALGHRRIAYARNKPIPGFDWSASARYAGYQEELRRHGLAADDQMLIEEADGVDFGERVAAVLLAVTLMPTALFVENDTLAMNLMTALHRTGIRVPEDLSIIGFDGQPLGAAFGLTTIAQPVYDLAARTGRIAVELANSERVSADPVTIPTRLVLRSSTKSVEAANSTLRL